MKHKPYKKKQHHSHLNIPQKEGRKTGREKKRKRERKIIVYKMLPKD